MRTFEEFQRYTSSNFIWEKWLQSYHIMSRNLPPVIIPVTRRVKVYTRYS